MPESIDVMIEFRVLPIIDDLSNGLFKFAGILWVSQ
jgi:hypothetical protein